MYDILRGQYHLLLNGKLYSEITDKAMLYQITTASWATLCTTTKLSGCYTKQTNRLLCLGNP